MDLVRALLIEGDDIEAETQLRRVLAEDAASADAHWLLGRILTERGQFAEAGASYERALVAAPAKAGVWYDLVRLRTLTDSARPLIRRMLAAANEVDVADDRVKVHLAIAKAYDDLDDCASAIRHITKANQARKSLATFDREATKRHVDALIARFTRGFLERRAAQGDPSEAPVMIVGLPRSGTTLVEQILSAHPLVEGAGELHFWSTHDPLFEPQPTEAWWSTYQPTTARSYLDALSRAGPGADRVIDKNPFNFFRLGLIHIVFPRAILIHCRRHPIDTCLSIAANYLAPRSDLPVDPEDMVFYYRQYDRLMDHWRAALPADRLIKVDYESLIADPEGVSHRLIDALGLAWDPACLRPEENPRRVKTNSAWQVRQPVYSASVERWRRYEPWLGHLRALARE